MLLVCVSWCQKPFGAGKNTENWGDTTGHGVMVSKNQQVTGIIHGNHGLCSPPRYFQLPSATAWWSSGASRTRVRRAVRGRPAGLRLVIAPVGLTVGVHQFLRKSRPPKQEETNDHPCEVREESLFRSRRPLNPGGSIQTTSCGLCHPLSIHMHQRFENISFSQSI